MAKNPAAVALGSIRSPKKAASSRENGKKGGRPRSAPTAESLDCPYCGRLMSEREAREQHACNDCIG